MQLKTIQTNFLGRNVIFYKETDSTQKRIWELVEKDSIENGTLVCAELQTEGKGTHGRIWHTDEENNIAFSMFVNMNCDVERTKGLTYKIAEIITEIFREKYQIELSIKEPNDIVYNGKKIGGILTESKIYTNKVKFLVIGIGINTNKQKFTDDIKDIATSIKKEFDVDVDTNEFIAEFCTRLEIEIIKRMG